MMGRRTKPERVAQLAAEKSKKIQLTNHVTGWNCLTRIWDEHPEHKQILQAMDYDGQAPPLNFSYRAFDPENGSKGKCPVTAEEWQKVGIQEPKRTFPQTLIRRRTRFSSSATVFKAPHNHCSDLIAPGTMVHIGSKTLHLAATNQTTGEHHNTAPVSGAARSGPRSERSTRPTDRD